MKQIDLVKVLRWFSPELLLFLVVCMFFLPSGRLSAQQIYEPEGLNMPGAWNGWANPPSNLALASSTQVPGGRVTKIPTGIIRWQTIFSVAESGGDLVGGTYPWLFTSGPSGSPWGNKWANVNVIIDSLQQYTYQNGLDNQITLENGKWYTMNWEDNGYNNTRAIFMQTSAQPVTIASVSVPGSVDPGNPVNITITLSQSPSPEEKFFLRYTIDSWNSSVCLPVPMIGLTGTVQIPGQPADTTVSYYAFSSVKPSLSSFFDLYTIVLNNNGGPNYTYTVQSPAPVVTFANLQSPATGNITAGSPFQVTGHVGIPGLTGQTTPAPGLEAWVGCSLLNTNPASWTNWTVASYVGISSFFDVFMADIGAAAPSPGTWYYATRYRLNGGDFVYGGYSLTGGGFWNGTSNVSGILTVSPASIPANRVLQNIAVEPEQTYCYDATQTITVAGGESFFKVLNGGSVTLIAGQMISMLPGTGVASGGYLLAKISANGQYCNPSDQSSLFVDDTDNESFTPGKNFTLFPNPAAESFTIACDELRSGEILTCVITDLFGSGIREEHFHAGQKMKISTGGWAPGMYLVRLSAGKYQSTLKLIKQ